MRLILLFIATFLFADEKLLISKFENLQDYYYNHQIVNLKLKIISAQPGAIRVVDDKNIIYPVHQEGDNYVSNISFELNDKFPTFYVKLLQNGLVVYKETVQIDPETKILPLHPPKDFCGVLANSMKITDKILSAYDDKNNIVYWDILTDNGNIKSFHLNFSNEKLDVLESNGTFVKASYSALVPLHKTDFEFSYFNLKDETYKKIKFHIDLKTDSVSTQTDIKPMTKNNIYIISVLLGVLIVLWIVLFIYRRHWIYIILILLTIAPIVWLNQPKKTIIVHKNVEVHILPFKKSTVFVIVDKDTKVKLLMKKDGWSKIQFGKYIGWIKDE